MEGVALHPHTVGIAHSVIKGPLKTHIGSCGAAYTCG